MNDNGDFEQEDYVMLLVLSIRIFAYVLACIGLIWGAWVLVE